MPRAARSEELPLFSTFVALLVVQVFHFPILYSGQGCWDTVRMVTNKPPVALLTKKEMLQLRPLNMRPTQAHYTILTSYMRKGTQKVQYTSRQVKMLNNATLLIHTFTNKIPTPKA
jgi:hypothetical protein